MRTSYQILPNLNYLQNKSKIINYEVIAGPRLHPIQMYDVIFDEKDMEIRFPSKNTKSLRAKNL